MSTFKIWVGSFEKQAGIRTFVVNLRSGLRKRKIPFNKVDVDAECTSWTNNPDLIILLMKYDASISDEYYHDNHYNNLLKNNVECNSACSVVTFAPRGKELELSFLKTRSKLKQVYQIKGRLSELPEFKSVREDGKSIFDSGESVGASEMNTVIEEIIAKYLVPRGIV